VSAPSPARRVAFEVLRRVFEHDAWADRSLRSAAERAEISGRERRHAQRLAFGAVQRRGSSDHFLAALSERSPARIDPPLLAALRLGLYEVLFEPPGDEHAVVDAAVELAKGGGRPRRGTGLVNAVLRRAVREREALLGSLDDSTPAAAAVAHSVPEWIARMWWEELGGERARELLGRINEPSRRCYRVNPLRPGPWAAEAALEPLLGPARGGRLVEPGPERAERIAAAVSAGELVPQSPGSAAAVELLAPERGERVLDLCAAPGIKTTQIAAALGGAGELVAVERDAGRARELAELCARAGAGAVTVRHGDARELDLGGGYDRVLVDAPCTGLGTLASRPDARWRRRAGDVETLAALGRGLLERALGATRPGGAVVFSLCTVSRREGAAVAAAVAEAAGVDAEDLGAARPELADPGDGRFLQLFPGGAAGDGFFFARLRRAGAGG
jgi:16S rRNA (cytosine967-C5)-methyltransferase